MSSLAKGTSTVTPSRVADKADVHTLPIDAIEPTYGVGILKHLLMVYAAGGDVNHEIELINHNRVNIEHWYHSATQNNPAEITASALP